MITKSEATDILNDAMEQLAEGFQGIEYVLKNLPVNVRQDFLNPEIVGPISAFLGQGNGYEPYNPKAKTMEDLVAIVDEMPDDEEDEDEDEESFNEESFDGDKRGNCEDS